MKAVLFFMVLAISLSTVNAAMNINVDKIALNDGDIHVDGLAIFQLTAESSLWSEALA